MQDLDLPFQDQRGSTNLFIASELYEVGGHTRVLSDLTKHSRHRNLVVLTDIFDHYAKGAITLGRITRWLNASVVVLPEMPLIDKSRNLMRLISTIDIHTVGILAHHEDVVANAACNDLISAPQVYVHHADHNPTLGSTVSHYAHLDLFPGNKIMCEREGFVSPEYLPILSKRDFQLPKDGAINTATAGSFAKFALDGPLSYADIVAGILSAIDGKHVHVGELTPDYLPLLEGQLVERGVDPSRFVYLGPVVNLQAALIENEVRAYVTSAPVGGGKTYVEVLGLGLPILIYQGSGDADRLIDSYNIEASYGDHPRWSSPAELNLQLQNLDIAQESERSRRAFMKRYSDDEYRRVVELYF